MDEILVKKAESIFDEPESVTINKFDFVNHLKNIVDTGGEISWLTTDTKSFDWAEINSDIKRFLNDLVRFHFKTASVGIFYSKAKKTEYAAYRLI